VEVWGEHLLSPEDDAASYQLNKPGEKNAVRNGEVWGGGVMGSRSKKESTLPSGSFMDIRTDRKAAGQ